MEVQQSIKSLWNHLGSFWGDFQNKDRIEYFWSALASGIQTTYDYLIDIQKSRSFDYANMWINISPELYTIVVSGLTQNIYAGSGIFTYPIEEWIYSIPTLTQKYKTSTTTVNKTYTEGLDYYVSGYNSLVWTNISGIQYDNRYPNDERLEVFASQVLQINPIIMNTWGRALDFRRDYITQYATYKNSNSFESRLLHIKYLLWALTYKSLNPPSVKNLRDAYGIVRGMPFAYNSGVINNSLQLDSSYIVTVDDDTYYLPSGLVPLSTGSVLAKFDLLASGLDLYDYQKYPNQIATLSGINMFNQNNTLRYTLSTAVQNISGYNSDFLDSYMTRLLPAQQQFYVGTQLWKE